MILFALWNRATVGGDVIGGWVVGDGVMTELALPNIGFTVGVRAIANLLIYTLSVSMGPFLRAA